MTTEQCGDVLWRYATEGQAEEIDALLKHRGPCESIELPDQDGATLLHWAVRTGAAKAASLLIDRGADVNARTKSGDTPLVVAAREGNAVLTRLLLKHGADTEIGNQYGWVPLHLAVLEVGNPEVVRLLIEHGAQIDVKERLR